MFSVKEKEILFDNYITVSDGIISYIGKNKPDGEIEDFSNCFILPGFIDIHCHDGKENLGYENPEEMAKEHLSHGTTSLLITLYRNLSHETILNALSKIKALMENKTNIIGAHLEGPYLNPGMGVIFKDNEDSIPNENKYNQYIKSGIIKNWTCSPEIPKICDFIEDVRKKSPNTVISIGHSVASFPQICMAKESGASLVTHVFDATGYTHYSEPFYRGTRDLDFDLSVMYLDGFYYEVICDDKWIHVRREMLGLLIKTVGKDRIICITDCMGGKIPNDNSQINIVDGDLAGSRLTMDCVAKNLFNAGFSFIDIAKFTSTNASKCMNLTDRGVLQEGKRGDLVILDKNSNLRKIIF